MERYKTLEFFHGRLKFSAGHFTIFSKNKRERIHGHNYHLHALITAALAEPGITFDYDLFHDKLLALCQQLHSRFLLPGQSPYLTYKENATHYHFIFNHKTMSLLKEDVLVLPLANITLEELSRWFVEQITQDKSFLQEHDIVEIVIKVFNGPEHCASTLWRNC